MSLGGYPRAYEHRGAPHVPQALSEASAEEWNGRLLTAAPHYGRCCRRAPTMGSHRHTTLFLGRASRRGGSQPFVAKSDLGASYEPVRGASFNVGGFRPRRFFPRMYRAGILAATRVRFRSGPIIYDSSVYWTHAVPVNSRCSGVDLIQSVSGIDMVSCSLVSPFSAARSAGTRSTPNSSRGRPAFLEGSRRGKPGKQGERPLRAEGVEA